MIRAADHVICADLRCGTLLPAGAEICDECGGSRLEPLPDAQALLVAAVDDRHVALPLDVGHGNPIGRSTPGVDLSRLPGSDYVHHLHATITYVEDEWRITHQGQNPVVIHRRGQDTPLEPGATTPLSSGDGLLIGRVRLQFLVVGAGAGLAV